MGTAGSGHDFEGFLCWSVWAERAKQHPSFLVDSLIHSAATMIVGPSYVGKTTLVAAIAAAVARGESTFAEKFQIRGRGRVLVAATDPGETNRWGERMGAWSVPRDAVRVARVVPHAWGEIIAEAWSERPALFVLDNVLGMIRGNPNDSDGAAEVLRPLGELADAGIPVVAIHHTPKPQAGGWKPKTPMGSVAFQAWPRHLLTVDQTADEQLRVSVTSNDHAPTSIHLGVERRGSLVQYKFLEATAKSTQRKRKVDTQAERRELGLRILADSSLAALSQRELAEKLGESQSSIQRALEAAGAEKKSGVWQASE